VYLQIKILLLIFLFSKKSISLSSSSSPTIQQQNSINSPIIYHKNGNLKFSPLKSAPSIESTGTINPSSDETITMVMVIIWI